MCWAWQIDMETANIQQQHDITHRILVGVLCTLQNTH